MSDTTPQDRAVAALIERFRPHVFPFVGIKPDMDRAEKAIYQYRELTFGEIVDCLTEAGLLSSGTPQEEDGSLRSEPSADGEASVYVLLSGRQVGRTVEHYNGALNVDMDDYDEPVGVEILDAREVTINGRTVHPPKAIPEGDTEELHRIRQVLHDNNLGCAGQPGKHDKVAREILAALRPPEAIGEAAKESS